MSVNGAIAEERLPPQNIEAEKSVLGSLLIDRDAISRVSAMLRPEDFYRGQHQLIYEAAQDLSDRREPADLVTLADELQRRNRLNEAGGASYLASLIAMVPTAVHVEHYGRIVARCAILRRLIAASGQIAGLAFDSADAEAEDTVDKAESILFGIAERQRSQDFLPIKTIVTDYFDHIEYLHQHSGQTLGVPTGFHDLDRLTGGLQRSDLVIVAARPSMGKTTLALNIAQRAALDHEVPVAVFSLEMSKEQLAQRLVCAQAQIDSHRVRTGALNDTEWMKIGRAVAVLEQVPMFIDDTAGISIMELRAKARRLQAEHEIGLVLVDYLQLMQGRRHSYSDNRVQEISEISRSLKSLARELNVPVVAMSQLSRAVEQRPDRRPILSDLRDSGAIEQDADVVMFIYREEMYDPRTDQKGKAKIILAKHRNGPTGEVELGFHSKQTRFVNLDSRQQHPEHDAAPMQRAPLRVVRPQNGV